MTNDQLQKATNIKARISDAEKLIMICEQFGKQRYKGALPSEVTGFINSDPELCLEIVNLIKQKADEKLQQVKQEFNSL